MWILFDFQIVISFQTIFRFWFEDYMDRGFAFHFPRISSPSIVNLRLVSARIEALTRLFVVIFPFQQQ